MTKFTLMFVFLTVAICGYAKDYEFKLVNPRPIGSTEFPTLNGLNLAASYEKSGENLFFAYDAKKLNENGVCVALGYERALHGSSRASYFSLSNVVHVNSKGQIVGGSTKSKKITKITCLNITNKKIAKAFLFFGININGRLANACLSRDPAKAKKDADILCKAIGYNKSFMYVRNSYSYDNSCEVINVYGDFLDTKHGEHGDSIRKVGCVK